MDKDKRLRDLIQHAYTNAPATQARFDKYGLLPDDIRGVADLQKLPILPKDAVIALQQANPPFGGLLAVPMSEVDHIFFSPGPLYEPSLPLDDPAWEMGSYSLRRAGFQPNEVVLNSLSYHLVPLRVASLYARSWEPASRVASRRRAATDNEARSNLAGPRPFPA
jgi:phenylacetate-CoA ligase